MKIKNNRLVLSDGRMTAWASSPNIGGQLSGGKPSALIMHYTAGGSASGTVNYFRQSSAGVSAHLVIGRDGEVTQMVKFNRKGWHAGKSRWRGKNGMNSYSIGIEMANMGKLKQTASGRWANWSGKSVPDEKVVLAEHRHFPGKEYGWEIYPEAQLMAAVGAAQAIVKEYGLDPWDVVGHEDVSMHRKIDPGPAFDLDKFRTMVFGRDEDSWNTNLYKVESTTGLNLRIAPSLTASLIEKLADGAQVHVIEKIGNWWLVAKIVNNNEDVTGYAHRNWLVPA